MALSTEDVARVAHLARLQLTDNELVEMTRQLASIMAYVDQLQKLDTKGVEPMAHALPMANVFRADEPGISLTVEQALANAPKRKTNAEGNQFYAVPAVLESGS